MAQLINVPSVVACASGALTVAVGQTSPICSSVVTDDSVDPCAPIVFAMAPATTVWKPEQNSGDWKAAAQSTAAEDETVGRSFTLSTSIALFSTTHEKKKSNIYALTFVYVAYFSSWLSIS